MRLLETLNPDGVNEAKCADSEYDPEWWFKPETETLAKSICVECPIMTRCLQYAIDEKIEHGIFGGATVADRLSIRRIGRIKQMEGNAR